MDLATIHLVDISPVGTLIRHAQDERGYLIVPHEIATGADCDGWLVVKERGEVADLVCNSCAGVFDTVPIGGNL